MQHRPAYRSRPLCAIRPYALMLYCNFNGAGAGVGVVEVGGSSYRYYWVVVFGRTSPYNCSHLCMEKFIMLIEVNTYSAHNHAQLSALSSAA